MKSASGAPCDPLYLVVEPGTRSKTARISQERVLPFPHADLYLIGQQAHYLYHHGVQACHL